ncbi:MAG: S8 family serine peptidase [Melioribacteraceae bacterium]|nr:MAG: S8 family serine peptidase [Melioribacteraceae bacterium]
MRNIILLLLLVALLINAQEVLKNDPYNITYEPDVILFMINDEYEIDGNALKAKGNIVTGLDGLDAILTKYRVKEIKKLFENFEVENQQRLFKDYYGNEHEVKRLDKIYEMKYEAEIDPKELASKLSELSEIEYAEPDYHFHANAVYPDDPLYQSGDQWHINAVNAPEAWELTTGDTTQVIAIIDTGVDWLHPDLDDNIWINKDEIPGNGIDDDGNGFVDDIRGWDFINNDNNPMDDNSHGTHVAGIAAAEGNNGVGVTGINWHAKIMPVKMLQSNGRGNSSDLAEAITYASQNRVDVINMSLGSYGESLTVKIALENAYAYSVLVAAAGNNGYKVDPPYPPAPYFPSYPACYGFVIGVEASTSGNERALFSNYDPSGPVAVGNPYNHNYEIMAPGVNIESIFPNGGYKGISGTSMASPIVAGAVSLMKLFEPNQSTEEIFAKLIQGTTNGVLDIEMSMTINLVPNLSLVEYAIVDTLDGDGDGIADAGETIEIYFTVKNAGGYADSVWSKIRFGEYEDQSVATILDSTSYIGDISAYGTMTGELDPFRIYIDPDVANSRDIVFEYEIGHDINTFMTDEITINIQNGIELSGFYNGMKKLYPNKEYIITGNAVFDSLIIYPGTILRIDQDISIIIDKFFYCKGKPDSLILFTKNGNNYWNRIDILNNAGIGEDPYFSEIEYCIFEYSSHNYQIVSGASSIENSIFRYNFGVGDIITSGNIRYSNFYYNQSSNIIYYHSGVAEYNNIISNETGYYPPILGNISSKTNNNFFDNYQRIPRTYFSIGLPEGSFSINYLPSNYFGSFDNEKIDKEILDFFDNSDFPIIEPIEPLFAPSPLAHGIVWKVEVNGIDPQDEHLDPLGSETVRFDVYFNRSMDVASTPFLTFGVREPYTQHIVTDNSSWSADSTIWTAFYTFGLETGDGINTIRVANARDDEYFEIPIENSRFKFVLQAAGAASTEFLATADIGKVNLEWPVANTDDELGYNMYRYYMVDESTTSDTTRINQTLITDSTYTDYNVIPDTTYRYYYTVLGTDMAESDPSKTVAAKPFNASKGDANGDLEINVLDITTIVSYLLNQNPQPFLSDAADVNNDGFINVLDIVASVNIIMGNSNPKIIASSGEPLIQYDDKTVRLKNGDHITAIYLKALVNIESEYRLVPNELMKRMEFGFNVVNDTLYMVAYNLNNRAIEIDEGSLFTINNGKIKEIIEVSAADQLNNLLNVTISNSKEEIPNEFVLFQNYPNPFNPTTTIKYGLKQMEDVEIKIINILGQLVWEYKELQKPVGYHEVLWNSLNSSNRNVASGVYIYQIKAGSFFDAMKMILLK